MNNYCTLFDSNYLTRGLALYNSLKATGEEFMLYVFAFDDLAREILESINLAHMIVISLQQFESEELLAIKKTRLQGEYCWTCTPFTIEYILNNYGVEEVTYLDSDLYFFDRPEILLQEFRESKKDVMITEHRYTPEYDQTEKSGIYCVQFMTFRNTENSRYILAWWRDRCAEWCFSRMEDGKFGDQKYLDDWLERFSGVHVLQNIGGGVAPWNVQQYKCTAGPMVNEKPIIFYHFHYLKWKKEHIFDVSDYRLSADIMKYLYQPYVGALENALQFIRSNYAKGFSRGIENKRLNFIDSLRNIRSIINRRRMGCYNVIQK